MCLRCWRCDTRRSATSIMRKDNSIHAFHRDLPATGPLDWPSSHPGRCTGAQAGRHADEADSFSEMPIPLLAGKYREFRRFGAWRLLRQLKRARISFCGLRPYHPTGFFAALQGRNRAIRSFRAVIRILLSSLFGIRSLTSYRPDGSNVESAKGAPIREVRGSRSRARRRPFVHGKGGRAAESLAELVDRRSGVPSGIGSSAPT